MEEKTERAVRHETARGEFMIFPYCGCGWKGWKVRVEVYLKGEPHKSPVMLPEEFASENEAIAAGKNYAEGK